MYRYRFAVEYLGSDLAGWQIQPGKATVQSLLEEALATCLRTQVNLTGAGRTDAGVHALGQVAHFDCPFELDVEKTVRSVNGLTPNSVFMRKLELCTPGFHARYSAQWRYYRYTLSLRPTALFYPVVWAPCQTLDKNLFTHEIRQVKGIHDFNSFSVTRNDGKPTECHMFLAEVEDRGHWLIVHLQANRFLHKMVRSIVGACFDVGRKYHPPGLIKTIFEQTFAGERTWAPACGLCLVKVGYEGYEY